MKIITGVLAVVLVIMFACKAEGELYEKNNVSDSVISITTQPVATTNVVVGSISGILSVSASVTQNATLSYQWYNSTSNSNTSGVTISDAISASFTIPTTLAVGTYYYFCEVRATGGATPVRTNVATINVIASRSGGWTQKADFAGGEREFAVGFSIGHKGYVGIGDRYIGRSYEDFWEYDSFLNVWTQKADFAGGSRIHAVGFSIGNKGYIGTGFPPHRQDFWEYDPITNIWTQKVDFAGSARNGAVGFSIGNKGYVGTGNDDTTFKKDFWEYDPDLNVWTQKADFAGSGRTNAVGFSIGNKGYIGIGYGNGGAQKDFWEYNPDLNTWIKKADFAGRARWNAVGFSIRNKGYIGTAAESSQDDFWEYDPVSNVWTQKVDFAGSARYGAVGFAIGDKGYIGTGSSSTDHKDFWEFTP